MLLFGYLATAAFSIPAAEQAQPAPAPDTATARAASLAELFGDPVLARGQGVEIKRSQLDDAFTAWKANLAARGQTIVEEQRTFRESQLLDKLIITQLLMNRASAGDKAVAKAQAEKFITESKNEARSEDAFASQLKALGLSPEQFNKQIMEQALAEAVLEREVKSKLSVSTGQIEDFYKYGIDPLVKIMQEELERLAKDPNTTVSQLSAVKQQIEDLKKANLANLEQPEKVRVSHVLLATRNRETDAELPEEQKKTKRQKIEKILVRAKAGEDFAKLVMEFSEDRGLKETKGEYTFSRSDPFVPEFKSASFSLQTNQISDIVTTMFGYHIIKCLEKVPAQKVELAKVSTKIKEALLDQEQQSRMPGYFDRLKKEAKVEILEPKYKPETSRKTESKPPAGQ
jgi:parvulin-like peptidyl-prolyl isomerase